MTNFGVDNIPGTPEYMERYKISKAIFNKVINGDVGSRD